MRHTARGSFGNRAARFALRIAVLASVLSGQYDLDGEYAVATVFVTTILSAITVPLWLALVR